MSGNGATESKRAPAGETPTARAYVLVDRPSFLAAEALAKQLAHYARGRYAVGLPPQPGGECARIELDGRMATVLSTPTPAPWGEIEPACKVSWWWEESAQVCQSTHGHFVVSVPAEPDDPIGTNLMLTALTAAVADASGAPAIFWCAATVIQKRSIFLESAAQASREFLPLHLWVGFVVSLRPSGSFLFATDGMDTLGLMEIECVASPARPSEIVELLYNAAHYQCDRGAVIKDGDTLGTSENDRILVRHEPSEWEGRGTVLRLYPNP